MSEGEELSKEELEELEISESIYFSSEDKEISEEKWMPPEDMSVIPEEILAQIPEEYYYWMAEDPVELRTALEIAIQDGEVVIKTPAELNAQLESDDSESLDDIYTQEKIELVRDMRERIGVIRNGTKRN